MVAMNMEELTAGIQFVVDGRGNVTSVVLSSEVWHHLIAHLEDAEDRELLSKLAPKLAEGPAGALRWSEIEKDWA
jgi:hypothetical protein